MSASLFLPPAMNSSVPESLLLRAAPGTLGTQRPDNLALAAWIDESIALCQPDQVLYCDGSEAESEFLLEEACRLGVLTLPFCGYHTGDYFAPWLEMGEGLANPPLIFGVNWFRRATEGRFPWPGFGENLRVLKWSIDRCKNRVGARETATGAVPRRADFDLDGLPDFSEESFVRLTTIQADEWDRELDAQGELFATLGSHLPPALLAERERLRVWLAASPEGVTGPGDAAELFSP